MAMIAAKGRLPDKAPQRHAGGREDQADNDQRKRGDDNRHKASARGTGNMCRSCGKTIVVLTVWFIRLRSYSGQHFGRAEHVKGVGEGPHRVLIGGEAHVPALGHVGEVLNDPAQVGIAMPP